MISGNVNSYSCCLNEDPDRLALIQEVHKIAAATCAEVSANMEDYKRTEAAAKKQHEANKKKLLKEIEDDKKAEELRPALEEVMAPFLLEESTVEAFRVVPREARCTAR